MGSKATRVAFGEALARLGGENPDIVVLDADLSKSTMTEFFAKKYPQRFFDVGIAEGNMVGMGAGMAMVVWFGGFIVIGAVLFQMWQTPIGAGSFHDAFIFAAIVKTVLEIYYSLVTGCPICTACC